MLPGPPTPASRSEAITLPQPPWRRPLLAALLVALIGLGLLGLNGCQAAGQPPRAVLLQALGLQIELTQQSIAEALELEPSERRPQVSRVRVDRQETIPIGLGKGLHLTGQFDWRLADDPYRVDSPFELYLLRGERGESWRLARPTGASGDSLNQEWLVDPLPLAGDRPA
jgi:hypothetical protein